MYGVTDLTTFILGTIFIVLLPGPNSLLVMTLASRQGLQAGYRASAGIVVGDTILMLLAATGAASALHASPAAFAFLKYAGAAYLAWLGWGLLRSAIKSQKKSSQTAAAKKDDPARSRHPFKTALVISLLNPKAIMFFVSFFIQFVDPAYPHPWVSFLILGVLVQICSITYLWALIFGGTQLSGYFGRHQTLTASFTGSVGVLFIGFALKLAGASLS